jgi:2-iminobutanoate/2-iminopropanoate deaminase
MVEGDITAQTERVLQNLGAVLKAAGLGFAEVLKTTVYLTDMADFAAVNEVYARCFPKEPPARACIQVAALPKGARIEIDAVVLAA